MTCLTCKREIPAERVAAVRRLRGEDPEYCVKCQPPTALVLTPLILEALADSEVDLSEMFGR